MRILVAEDERDLNRLICRTLERAGYSVDACFDGEAALDYLLGAEYDCLLLDIMMPKKDGREVLREVRAQGSAVPVIFLTARDSVQDRIEGLDLGADDYLVKPFDFDELLARIRAATRKYGTQKTSVLTLADLTVDTGSHTVTRGGKEIRLSAKEYAILQYMMQHKGTVISAPGWRTISGIMTIRAARMWSMCISPICAKRSTTALTKSCCIRSAARAGF